GNKRNLLPQPIGAILPRYPRRRPAQQRVPCAIRIRRQSADGFAPRRRGLVIEASDPRAALGIRAAPPWSSGSGRAIVAVDALIAISACGKKLVAAGNRHGRRG